MHSSTPLGLSCSCFKLLRVTCVCAEMSKPTTFKGCRFLIIFFKFEFEAAADQLIEFASSLRTSMFAWLVHVRWEPGSLLFSKQCSFISFNPACLLQTHTVCYFVN